MLSNTEKNLGAIILLCDGLINRKSCSDNAKIVNFAEEIKKQLN